MRSWTAEVTALGLVVRIEARFYRLAARVPPAIPYSCEREQLPFVDLETVRLLCFSRAQPFVKAVRGNQAPPRFQRIAEGGFVAAVSDLALIIRAAADGSVAQEGMSPQRISDNSRTGSIGFWRIRGTGWVGAMLKLGAQSGSSETLSKCSSMNCFRRDNL
jgi:hypothetical protein